MEKGGSSYSSSSSGWFCVPNKKSSPNSDDASLINPQQNTEALLFPSKNCTMGEKFSGGTNLQPFDVFPRNSTSTCNYPGMAGNVHIPFTFSQWKELERQAMIYKYMVASVPVPNELFFSRNYQDSSDSSRFSKTGDLEPGRCKRTDGKKWRCSRDVSPHQKYCERHLHRGRPRSRKPVEGKLKNGTGENQKKTRLQENAISTARDEPNLVFNEQTDLSISTPSYKGTTNRDFRLVESETDALDGAEQQWQNMMGTNVYNFHQDYVEHQPLNLFSYANFPTPEIETSPGFIEYWPIDIPNAENLPPSLDLSMAMAAGNDLDEAMRNIPFENSVKECDDDKTRDSRFLYPVSWEPFPRGGPLAEALQSGRSIPSSP